MLQKVRALQLEILSNYAGDFSKHAPAQEVPRIDMVWQSLLGQLSKENKKFVYGVLKKGGRAKEYKGAFTEQYVLQQLLSSGFSNIYYFSAQHQNMTNVPLYMVGME